VLRFHHGGVQHNFKAVDGIVASDLEAGFLAGPFCYCPPTEPFRSLPRNVVLQSRFKQAEDGTFFEWDKPRATTNSSFGPELEEALCARRGMGRLPMDSPNAGLSTVQTTTAMPTAQRHGAEAAVVDAFGSDGGVHGGAYSTDRTNAFSFLPTDRAEWWLQGFVWDPSSELPMCAGPDPTARRGPCVGDACSAAMAHEAAEAVGAEHVVPCPQEGVGFAPNTFGWMVGMRCHFGGGHMPQRFNRVAAMECAVTWQRQRAFDVEHPFPACVQRTQGRRRMLQQAGALPQGERQLTPAGLQYFIDDHGGSGLMDITGVPASLRRIVLDVSVMALDGGIPAPMDSRLANYARIDIATALEMGFEISLKTQVGDPIVSLGLRVGVATHRLDCPPSKQRTLLVECATIAREITQPAGVPRAGLERLVGRLGNIAQIEPELLLHLHVGYVLTYRIPTRYQQSRFIKVRDRRLREFQQLLETGATLVTANEGVPLLRPAGLGVAAEDTLVLASDASRQGDSLGSVASAEESDDGVGGLAFDPSDPEVVYLISEPWPRWAREALAASAARRALRHTLTSARLPMPAAELFGGWACSEAVQTHLGRRFGALVAIGDCQPAALAMTSAKSKSSVMRPLLAIMHDADQQQLGVWVPRELNTEPDLLSHPSNRQAVEDAARAAGWRPIWLDIPPQCWLQFREVVEKGEHV
jgi:hypothetical protein